MSSAERKFKWSRIDLTVAGTYAVLTAIAIGAALWSSLSGDPKGHFVLLQLPVALQLAAMPGSLLGQLGGISWVMAYLVIWPLTALTLYMLGHCLRAMLELRLN